MAWKCHLRSSLCAHCVQSETLLCVWCLTAELDVDASRSKFRWRIFHRLHSAEEQAMISATGCILAEFIKCFNSPFISSATIGLLIGGYISSNDSMDEFYRAIHLPGATCWRWINVVIEQWVRANIMCFFISPCKQTNTLKLIWVWLFWTVETESTGCLTHGSEHQGHLPSSAQLTSQTEFEWNCNRRHFVNISLRKSHSWKHDEKLPNQRH